MKTEFTLEEHLKLGRRFKALLQEMRDIDAFVRTKKSVASLKPRTTLGEALSQVNKLRSHLDGVACTQFNEGIEIKLYYGQDDVEDYGTVSGNEFTPK